MSCLVSRLSQKKRLPLFHPPYQALPRLVNTRSLGKNEATPEFRHRISQESAPASPKTAPTTYWNRNLATTRGSTTNTICPKGGEKIVTPKIIPFKNRKYRQYYISSLKIPRGIWTPTPYPCQHKVPGRESGELILSLFLQVSSFFSSFSLQI